MAKRPYTDKDKAKKKEYYQKNRDKILKAKALYFQNNKQKIYRQRAERETEDQRQRRLQYVKEWRSANQDKIEAYRNKDTIAGMDKNEYKKKHNREYSREYRKNNKERINQYSRNKEKTDEGFRVKKRLRTLLYIAMKRYSETGKIMSSKKYGVDYKSIIEYLGPSPGSGYHIDHILPLSAFDFNDPIHIKAAFAPENHQWLLGSENLSKGSKYDPKILNQYLQKFTKGLQ